MFIKTALHIQVQILYLIIYRDFSVQNLIIYWMDFNY